MTVMEIERTILSVQFPNLRTHQLGAIQSLVGTVTFFSNRYLRHIICIIGKSKKYTFQLYLMFIVISFVASTTLFQRCNMK